MNFQTNTTDWPSQEFNTSVTIVGVLTNGTTEYSNITTIQPSDLHDGCTYELHHIRLTVEFYIRGILLPIVCCIGICLNIVNLVIFTRPVMVNVTSIFYIGMVVADTATLLTLLCYYTYFYSSERFQLLEKQSPKWLDIPFIPWRIFFALYSIPTNIFITASNTHAMSVTVFRFIAVQLPTMALRICTRRKARKVSCIIFIWAILLNSPDFLQKRIATFNDGNKTISYVSSTDLYYSRVFQTTYYPTKVVLNIVIPWLVCFILSISLILTLRRKALKTYENHCPGYNRRRSSRAIRNERITITLLTINFFFILSQSPSAVWFFFMLTIDRDELYCDKFQLMRISIDTCLVLNFALNFVLYASTNREFRKCFSNTFLQLPGSLSSASAKKSSCIIPLRKARGDI
ncbi:unnamed protein product [Owenia fusiformis]|uniref:G-protein coupled receptors family 1 profile domain-containing protein n=1 Tax=Owenia fusiformis TaxID=6347 RepID=A0A8S4PQN8_OWEFU|nr:unnamed protein product [Owenia fusiformis]